MCRITLYYVVFCGLVALSVVSRSVCIVLYYIVLYCIVWSCCLQCSMEECLYRAVLYCITLNFVILLPLMQYGGVFVPCRIILYYIIFCDFVAFSVVWRSVCTVPCRTVLHCSVWSWCLQCGMEECLCRALLYCITLYCVVLLSLV